MFPLRLLHLLVPVLGGGAPARTRRIGRLTGWCWLLGIVHGADNRLHRTIECYAGLIRGEWSRE